MSGDERVSLPLEEQRRDVMKAPDEVSAMLRLKGLGWGSKRIAAELGCSRVTAQPTPWEKNTFVSMAYETCAIFMS
jgi:hypothetical protein